MHDIKGSKGSNVAKKFITLNMQNLLRKLWSLEMKILIKEKFCIIAIKIKHYHPAILPSSIN